MIASLLCAIVTWSIVRAYPLGERYQILFWMGVLFAGVLPGAQALSSLTFQGDFPYARVVEERRVAHQALVSLKKQVLLSPLDQALLEQLIVGLRDSQRFLEAVQVYTWIEKERPLSDQEKLLAATCLMDASPGIMPPKARIWLEGIHATSPLYPQVLLLKSHRGQ